MTGYSSSAAIVTEISFDPNAAPQPYEANHAASLVINLGRALLHVGAPAHRLESAMQIMAERLGLRAQFFCTPTTLIVSLGDDDRQQTFLTRSEPGVTDLSKLSDLTEVMAGLADGSLTPEQANVKVKTIDQAPPRYRWGWQLLGFVLLAGGVAPLIGGGLRETAVAMGLGVIVGTAVLSLQHHIERSKLITPLAATLVTFFGTLWCGFDPKTALMPTVTAGMIALLPGMELTTAARELATGHLVSGASRLAYGLSILALLAFGLVLGSMAGQWVVGPVPLFITTEFNELLSLIGIAFAAVGLMLLNQAHQRDWPWMLAACLLAWLMADLGHLLEAPAIGAFLGGLAVGLAGNAFVYLTGRPGSTLHIPGLIVLVPGSIGLRSMASLLHDNVAAGIETAMLAAIIAIALTTGMMIASVLVPPQKNVL